MADHISIRKATGTWVVRIRGSILGESTNALELSEGTQAPVIYFPRADVGMSFLEQTPSTTRCPHKGTATYYTVTSPFGDVVDAAWSYEAPSAPVDAIAGHVAFFSDQVVVEKL